VVHSVTDDLFLSLELGLSPPLEIASGFTESAGTQILAGAESVDFS
jgi:hypothetical protein